MFEVDEIFGGLQKETLEWIFTALIIIGVLLFLIGMTMLIAHIEGWTPIIITAVGVVTAIGSWLLLPSRY